MAHEQCRDRLICLVRIAIGIRRAVLKYVRRHSDWLLMEEAIKKRAAPGDRRFHHDQPPTASEHLAGGPQKPDRKLNVMQHIKHNDIAEASMFERQILCVGDEIQPWTKLNIRGN